MTIANVAADPVIRVRDLTKAYGDVHAVDGIDFDVAQARSSVCSGRTARARPRPSRSSRACASRMVASAGPRPRRRP